MRYLSEEVQVLGAVEREDVRTVLLKLIMHVRPVTRVAVTRWCRVLKLSNSLDGKRLGRTPRPDGHPG